MFVTRVVLLYVLVFIVCIRGRKGIGGSEQDWGYITVRPNAHMFWWLYYTTYNGVSNYTERPLIIWLQGGPGMSSSGYGNFLEIGPQNSNFHRREGSFVENFNVLFVDNPVGAGYSYISNETTKLVTNGKEIGDELYTFLKIFLTTHHTEFKDVPIYVFGESYGGKMALELVYAVKEKAKKKESNFCNLKGLVLADAYISPLDYIKYYAPLVLNLGLVDKRGFARIDEMTKQIQFLINNEEFEMAANLENIVMDSLSDETPGIDIYNFLSKSNLTKFPQIWDSLPLLTDIMNHEVKEKLNIPENVTWKFYGNFLYNSLRNDLLKSVTDKVEILLNTTDIKIIVYNGVMDILVNTAGTISWLDGLKWQGRERWFDQNQTVLIINEVSEGYYKKVDNLAFYAILRAGHSVPIDNLPVLNRIVEMELLE